MEKEKAKKLIKKAAELEQGKGLALAKEFLEIGEKIDLIAEEIKKKEAIVTELKGEKGDPGEKGADAKPYVLTMADKLAIAKSVKVPVVEKVIEKITTIREKPIVTNEVKEVAVAESAEVIVSKINDLPIEEEYQIDFSHIKGFPEFSKSDKRIGFGSMLKEAPRDGQYYARQNRAWVPVPASGITSLSAIGLAPNPNGATITGTVLNLEPASPSFGGVINTLTQSFEGQKTFQVTNSAASTLVTASGISSLIQNTGAGSITNAYGVLVNQTGTIGVSVGLYLQSLSGSTKYAIYADIAGSRSVMHRIDIMAGSPIRFYDSDSSNYAGISANPTTTANVDYTLPPAGPLSNGYVLSSTTAGVMSWIAASIGSLTSFSSGDLSPLFTTSVANATTTPALSFALSNAAANTYFGNATGGSTTPSFTAAGALTKTDDTNVTLTLGGNPATSLLRSASLTLGWSGQLSIARGGTGQSTATAAFDALAPSQTGNSGKYLTTNGTTTSWGGISSGATILSVAQTAHGFAVGDVIRNSGSANTYTKAQADSAANAEVVGIVTTIVDANNFIFTTEGIFTSGVPVATAGTVFFLDPSTAGALTSTEPTTAGQVSAPLVVVLQSGTTGLFYNKRGQVLASTATPSMILLSTTNASGATTVDFTGLSSTYTSYKVVFYGVTSSNLDTELRLRVGTGGTPTYQAGATDYWYTVTGRVSVNGGAPGSDDSSAIGTTIKVADGISNVAIESASGEVIIFNPSQSTQYHLVQGQSSAYLNKAAIGGNKFMFNMNFSGAYVSATAVTAIRFLTTAGTVSGTFKLYGII